MRNLTEQNLTEAVLSQVAKTENPRLREVMQSFVHHLHDFIREIEPTEEEWLKGIEFLTAVGHMCDDKRQEFILMSDTLGATMLMDAINSRKPAGATESSVLGPFYREGAADVSYGDSISGDTPGEPCVVSGRVMSLDGAPIADAVLDIWQTAPNGLYEEQDPNQPDMNLRGRVHTREDGSYRFRTVNPVSYPVPDDGPTGDLMRAMGRHPYRPAHIHFIVSAPGHVPVTTQLFMEGDPYLDSDAVFGVKDSLVVEFARHDNASSAREYGVANPYYTVEHDFVLTPAR